MSEEMGYYEGEWKERKEFLFKSMFIGAILAAILTVVSGIFIITTQEVNNIIDILQLVLSLVAAAIGFFLYMSAIVAVIRMIMTEDSIGSNAITNFIRGFWVTVIGMFTGGWIGIVIGFILMIVFIYLFIFVAFGYAIYLPISTIYLYIKYKKEKRSDGASV